MNMIVAAIIRYLIQTKTFRRRTSETMNTLTAMHSGLLLKTSMIFSFRLFTFYM
ncbi:MAG: hypothetical protein IKU45_05770 [Clostridia bacterium]|nr:hypothetical protein [Clostridia bacterium]